MNGSSPAGLERSGTNAESTPEQTFAADSTTRRQFLGAAAIAVGATATAGDATATEEIGQTKEKVGSDVWCENLIPARNALIKDPVNVTEAEEELRDALQKLEELKGGR